jgi:glutamate N-acetyltransferase / amino-acid N-acetyltransferase
LKLPLGYRYATGYAGIRKLQKDDIALIVPDKAAQGAAVFTRNVVQAAPVKLARQNLKISNGKVTGVLINAGNANCATRTGERVALASCKALAKALKTRPEYIVPASTGVIGVELAAKLLTAPLPELVEQLSADRFQAVAEAIMTTDTRAKTASEEIQFADGSVRVAGMTKGSGMIHPNMATTLGFVMTDAVADAEELAEILRPATERSFNSLSVDGDMSTNDTVLLLASGASNVRPAGKERKMLREAVSWVMESLAEQIAADGEGAKKLVVVRAVGFKTHEDARKVARAISNSPLVKTAIAGSDPNWGRILAAAGYAGVSFDPSAIDIEMQRTLVCRGGLAAPFNENELKQKLDEAEVRIRIVNRNGGKGEARFFTCDLTEGYIQINGSYRT